MTISPCPGPSARAHTYSWRLATDQRASGRLNCDRSPTTGEINAYDRWAHRNSVSHVNKMSGGRAPTVQLPDHAYQWCHLSLVALLDLPGGLPPVIALDSSSAGTITWDLAMDQGAVCDRTSTTFGEARRRGVSRRLLYILWS